METENSISTNSAEEEYPKFNVIREINELRNQFSLIKRIGFFFGAGASMAVGLPGIETLTTEIKTVLTDREKEIVDIIEASIKNNQQNFSKLTIEDVLNQIRLIRQITKDSKDQEFQGISGEEAKNIDNHICKVIYEKISSHESKANFDITRKFVSCINWFSREFTKEIFTTNYDLVLEKSFEYLQIPYFDGFVGSYEPFFLPESIDTGNRLDYPPKSWIRLWKLHGSLGWFWKENDNKNGNKVIRLGIRTNEDVANNQELVIYPSKEKYELSRKQPFIAYFDRLKHYLNEGEGLFIISGYSFSDEHINEIFFNSLQQNNRLHIITFLFSDSDMDKILGLNKPFLNFTAYSPNFAIISGRYGKWNTTENQENKIEIDIFNKFWDIEEKKFILGDFNNLVDFLIEISGKAHEIGS